MAPEPDAPMLVNLTPHPVVALSDDGEVALRLPAAGVPARRVEHTVAVSDGELVPGIPLRQVSYGGVEGLPPPATGTWYVVSTLVAAVADRADLIVPSGVVRDEHGAIVGCRAFARVDGMSLVAPEGTG